MTTGFSPPLSSDEVRAFFVGYRDFLHLANGGQGTIFKAYSYSQPEPVAIKVFYPGTAWQRAQREVDLLACSTSPYLATLVGHGRIPLRGDQCLYSITMFEEGLDLRRRLLQEARLSIGEVERLITHIGSAIDFLWTKKIVHCDITPANILRSESGVYKLIDLGLAKHLAAESITVAGAIMGTQGYIAPEQLRGRRHVTLRADLFSLGVIAYEAVTGRHPFNKRQEVVFSAKQLPPRPSTVIALPPQMDDAIMAMMALNPLDRPISAASVLTGLGGK